MITRIEREFPYWWRCKTLPRDVQYIEWIGKERNRISKERGWKSKTATEGDNWNVGGVAGEWAVSLAVFSNVALKADGNIEEISNGDLHGIVEVKTSNFLQSHKWNLVVNADQIKSNFYYVNCLTYVFPDWVVIQGWATGEEIKKDHRKSKHGVNGHDIMIYDYKKLHDIDKIFDEPRVKDKLKELSTGAGGEG